MYDLFEYDWHFATNNMEVAPPKYGSCAKVVKTVAPFWRDASGNTTIVPVNSLMGSVDAFANTGATIAERTLAVLDACRKDTSSLDPAFYAAVTSAGREVTHWKFRSLVGTKLEPLQPILDHDGIGGGVGGRVGWWVGGWVGEGT